MKGLPLGTHSFRERTQKLLFSFRTISQVLGNPGRYCSNLHRALSVQLFYLHSSLRAPGMSRVEVRKCNGSMRKGEVLKKSSTRSSNPGTPETENQTFRAKSNEKEETTKKTLRYKLNIQYKHPPVDILTEREWLCSNDHTTPKTHTGTSDTRDFPPNDALSGGSLHSKRPSLKNLGGFQAPRNPPGQRAWAGFTL